MRHIVRKAFCRAVADRDTSTERFDSLCHRRRQLRALAGRVVEFCCGSAGTGSDAIHSMAQAFIKSSHTATDSGGLWLRRKIY